MGADNAVASGYNSGCALRIGDLMRYNELRKSLKEERDQMLFDLGYKEGQNDQFEPILIFGAVCAAVTWALVR